MRSNIPYSVKAYQAPYGQSIQRGVYLLVGDQQVRVTRMNGATLTVRRTSPHERLERVYAAVEDVWWKHAGVIIAFVILVTSASILLHAARPYIAQLWARILR